MVFKLGHESEIGSLPFAVTGKLYDNLNRHYILSKYSRKRGQKHGGKNYDDDGERDGL